MLLLLSLLDCSHRSMRQMLFPCDGNCTWTVKLLLLKLCVAALVQNCCCWYCQLRLPCSVVPSIICFQIFPRSCTSTITLSHNIHFCTPPITDLEASRNCWSHFPQATNRRPHSNTANSCRSYACYVPTILLIFYLFRKSAWLRSVKPPLAVSCAAIESIRVCL